MTSSGCISWMKVWSVLIMEKPGQSKRRLTIQIIVDIILWLGAGITVLYLFMDGKPRNRGFFCDDLSIRYPYRRDTISNTVLVIAGFAIFFLTLLLVEMFLCIDRRCGHSCSAMRDWCFYVKTVAVFLVGFVFQQLIVQTVKKLTGVLRPNFWDVCKPIYNETLCPMFITNYTCSDTGYDVKTQRDAREAFPSGHAAFSMFIAVYLTIYIQQRFHIQFSRLLKPMMQFSLILTSLLCGFGRIVDNKHHMGDVFAGFGVGLVIAAAVHYSLGRNSQTEGEAVSQSSDSLSLQQVDCCGTCTETERLEEPQTPAPLLQHEFRTGGVDIFPVTKTKPLFIHSRRNTVPTTSRGHDV